MYKYILKRILSIIPTLFFVTLLVFFMIHLVPGDPAEMILGERANEQSLAQLREHLGLNEPLYVQYGKFMWRLAHGDLGRSITTNETILKEIGDRFPATVELAFFALMFASVMGVLAGIISATRQYSIFDYTSMIASLTGISMPIFWLGLILMMIFSVSLPLLPWDFLPLSGRTSPTIEIERITGLYVIDTIWMRDWAGLKDVLWHLILPAVTLSTIPMAIIARITRSSMLEVLRQDYVRTAKAKGLSLFFVHYKHALRNAMIPIITVIGLQLGIAMAGAILTETIFSWHGVGEWIIHAVNQRDFNAVQGGTIIIATVFVFINLIVDLLYIWINPKLRVN